MMWTTELTEEEERLLALIPDCPRRKKPLPLPRPRLVADRKLSVEGQRERVVREVKELASAERNAPHPDNRGVREASFYYRKLYEAVAYAEHWAKQKLDLRQYDLFEKDRV
jgi:hypothetical protein